MLIAFHENNGAVPDLSSSSEGAGLQDYYSNPQISVRSFIQTRREAARLVLMRVQTCSQESTCMDSPSNAPIQCQLPVYSSRNSNSLSLKLHHHRLLELISPLDWDDILSIFLLSVLSVNSYSYCNWTRVNRITTMGALIFCQLPIVIIVNRMNDQCWV